MLPTQDPTYDPNAPLDPIEKRKKDTDAKTGTVLVTLASSLVEIVLN